MPNTTVYVRTDIPGSDRPLIERGEAIQYLGNGSVSVRMSYGIIAVRSNRLSTTPPIDQQEG